jgi:hypothetical protein
LEVDDEARPSTKPIEGIDEKLLKSQDKKSGQNTFQNHENKKHCSTRYEMILLKHMNVLMQIKSLQGEEAITT